VLKRISAILVEAEIPVSVKTLKESGADNPEFQTQNNHCAETWSKISSLQGHGS
jgi:hypothetical protein